MAITEKYVSVAGGGSHDGSTEGNAYTLSEAIAAVSAGCRYNVKKGTYTRTGSDTVSADGTATAPIVWRGYNATIGDLDSVGRTGDNGVLNTTDYPVIAYDAGYRLASSGANYAVWQNIKITGTYSGYLFSAGSYSAIVRCSIDNASTNSGAIAYQVGAGPHTIIGCDLILSGGSGGKAALFTSYTCLIYANRISSIAAGVCVDQYSLVVMVVGNQFVNLGGIAIDMTANTDGVPNLICQNTIYSGGDSAIKTPNANLKAPYVVDNLLTDCTGYGLLSGYAGTADSWVHQFFNRNRDNSSGFADGFDDWISATGAGNITAVDGSEDETTDYVDASAGDLELKSTSPAAGKSSMPYRDIGAVQHVNFTLPDAKYVYGGVDRGDGTTGTLNASTIAAAKGSGSNLSAGILKDGEVVDDVTGTYAGVGGDVGGGGGVPVFGGNVTRRV